MSQDLNTRYEDARAAYEEAGLNNLSLAQLQDLIAGECGASTARMYATYAAARHYLVQALNYKN